MCWISINVFKYWFSFIFLTWRAIPDILLHKKIRRQKIMNSVVLFTVSIMSMERLLCARQPQSTFCALLLRAPCVLGVSITIVLVSDIRKQRLRERQWLTHDDEIRWDLDAHAAPILGLRAAAFPVWRTEHLRMWENVCVHSVCVFKCMHTYSPWDRPGKVFTQVSSRTHVRFWRNLWFLLCISFLPLWHYAYLVCITEERFVFILKTLIKIFWKFLNKEPEGNLQTSWKTKAILIIHQDGH